MLHCDARHFARTCIHSFVILEVCLIWERREKEMERNHMRGRQWAQKSTSKKSKQGMVGTIDTLCTSELCRWIFYWIGNFGMSHESALVQEHYFSRRRNCLGDRECILYLHNSEARETYYVMICFTERGTPAGAWVSCSEVSTQTLSKKLKQMNSAEGNWKRTFQ